MSPSEHNSPRRGDAVAPEWSPEGVDLTLIRWMLSMSPEERLETLQAAVRSLHELRHDHQRSA